MGFRSQQMIQLKCQHCGKPDDLPYCICKHCGASPSMHHARCCLKKQMPPKCNIFLSISGPSLRHQIVVNILNYVGIFDDAMQKWMTVSRQAHRWYSSKFDRRKTKPRYLPAYRFEQRMPNDYKHWRPSAMIRNDIRLKQKIYTCVYYQPRKYIRTLRVYFMRQKKQYRTHSG